MLHDFHTHTFYSDGILSPIELIRYAVVSKYATIGVTDHVALGSLNRLIEEISRDCTLAREYWDILAIPGVELTHVPPRAVNELAQQAKEIGAWIVVVHGETPTEPVQKGTNMAAIQSSFVDILAHPGLLTAEEANLAAKTGTFIELSARKGHSDTNPHVARVCKAAGARLIVNSDAHSDHDLLTISKVEALLANAGIDKSQFEEIIVQNPSSLRDKIIKSYLPVH